MVTRFVLVAFVVAVVFVPGPALADPAVPTNYRSEVEGISPGDAGTATIVGGDAFIDFEAAAGTEVVVLGYDGEPYLRFAPDGTVWENQRSPAAYLNGDRYGRVGAFPGDVDPDAEPRWVPVADERRWAWHDHRTHWMLPTPPSIVTDRAGAPVTVFDWSIPIVVDGDEGRIDGLLRWLPSVSPLPALAVAGFVALALLPAARHHGAVVLTGAAFLATILGMGRYLVQPPEGGGAGLDLVAPALALVVAGIALARRRLPTGHWYLLPALAAVAVWSLGRLPVATAPILPSVLPAAVDRFGTAAVWGAAMAVVAGFRVEGPRAGTGSGPTIDPGGAAA
ncbi:MAG TPA: hypothetical protein ENK55_10245 [Actinobacteria bacterium]|nr:hypothetical protein [Actinomycetota bacterium]